MLGGIQPFQEFLFCTHLQLRLIFFIKNIGKKAKRFIQILKKIWRRFIFSFMPISRDRGCIHCINVYGRIYEKKPYSKYCVDYNRNIK